MAKRLVGLLLVITSSAATTPCVDDDAGGDPAEIALDAGDSSSEDDGASAAKRARLLDESESRATRGGVFFYLCVRSSLICYSVVESGARFLIGVWGVPTPPRSAANVSRLHGIYGTEFAIPGCCSAGFRSNRRIGVDAREYSRSGGPSMGTSGNVPKN